MDEAFAAATTPPPLMDERVGCFIRDVRVPASVDGAFESVRAAAQEASKQTTNHMRCVAHLAV
jgi:hypothetical protein